MRSSVSRFASAGLAAAVTLLAVPPAAADDTEIFVGRTHAEGVRPNVLLILDTSGSMRAQVTGPGAKAPYRSDIRYEGACSEDTLYWARAGTAPPRCDSPQRIPLSSNACDAAQRAVTGPAGLWTGPLAQWNEAYAVWGPLRQDAEDSPLECAADASRHGPDASSPRRWARNGDVASPWTADENQAINWGAAGTYTLYNANWLNWYHAPSDGTPVSRLDVVKSVALTLVNAIDGVNIGLMRFSNNGGEGGGESAAEGGMVVHAVTDVAAARDSLAARIAALTPGGSTPLSETLYEAGQYLAGRSVDYGLDSRIEPDTPFPSVPESRRPDDASTYRSPVEYQCQRNYVVLLTDGDPSQDNSADEKIAALPGFGQLVGGCNGTGPGRCLEEMAEYLFETDLSPTLDGQQNATTYTIGFGPEVAGSALLERTARAGGGRAYSAANLTELLGAFQEIMGEIFETSSTFTTPSVAVNAFNRTQTGSHLYISVFRPEDSLHWPGNVKKYALRDGRILDALGRDAVDPATGFFRRGSQSFWSAAPDDDRVDRGGAVSRLPAPAARKVYTLTGTPLDPDLTASQNRLTAANLTDEQLGTGGTGPTRQQVVDWALGFDVHDLDGDGNRNEQSRFMGDPLHARPAIVTYRDDPDDPDSSDSVVFVPTNDGFLHAVDAATGVEQWAFIPPELLRRLTDLYRDPAVASRTYGLDGDVRVLRFDADLDGVIEPASGDRVWIYFGMRRGGRFYYALDVTDRSRPRLLWKLGPTQLPGVGETWSTPGIARVRVSGAAQNGEHLVLIFGGGYDEAQENYEYVTDSSGNRIYMVDAATGALLWYAGGPGSSGSPHLFLPQMTHSIPGRISIVDIDGDQFADRLYAADLGGRIWRFDIWNGRSADELVTGGVLANLGAAAEESPSIESTRRFYYAPDVALIQRRGAAPYFNIAIGSGYRGHPLHTGTHDRFYSIRDTLPFGKLTAAEYASFAPITESDLADITQDPAQARVPEGKRGWKLELRLNGGWVGEKVLAEAVTVNGVVLFPTYQPQPADASNPCVPVNGVNRVYALRADTGRPAVDFNDDLQLTAADVSTTLAQTGIAGEVSFLLEASAVPGGGTGGYPGDGPPNGPGNDGRDALGRRPLCVVGVEVLRKCVQPGSVVRTFWQRVNYD